MRALQKEYQKRTELKWILLRWYHSKTTRSYLQLHVNIKGIQNHRHFRTRMNSQWYDPGTISCMTIWFVPRLVLSPGMPPHPMLYPYVSQCIPVYPSVSLSIPIMYPSVSHFFSAYPSVYLCIPVYPNVCYNVVYPSVSLFIPVHPHVSQCIPACVS